MDGIDALYSHHLGGLLKTRGPCWRRGRFPVSVAAPADAMISKLQICLISIVFSEGYAPIVIHHDASIHPESVRLVLSGQVQGERPAEVKQHLRWRPGNQVILTGTLTSDIPDVFSVRVFLSIFS